MLEPEVLAQGLDFPESPYWSEKDGCLYFVEWQGNRLLRWKDDRLESVFATPPGSGPSGLGQDADGNFWLTLYDAGEVACYSPAGRRISSIDGYQGQRFRGACDLVMDPGGGLYFTDSGDFEEDWRSGRPLGSVYALGAAGALTRLAGNLCFPNGIALSPDRQTLYVAEHRQNRVRRYALGAGSVGEGDVFFRLDDACLLEPEAAFELGPDGMCVDAAGKLWVAHYGGGKLLCFDTQGNLVRTVRLAQGRRPTNVVYRADARCLYITEAEWGRLYRLRLA